MKNKKVNTINNSNLFSAGSPYNGLNNAAPTDISGGTPLPLTHQMVHAIKNSRKGQLPPGLARYLAAKKAAKSGK